MPATVRLLAWAVALRLHDGVLGASDMPLHSLGSPPDLRKLATEWYLGGTVTPTADTLVISPGVPGRIGMMWSMYPILTADFEVQMTFKARSLGTEPSGFAFWYVYENATNAQEKLVFEHAQNQQEIIDTSWFEYVRIEGGFGLFGYRNAYDGLGVFFDTGKDGSQPAVTALPNSPSHSPVTSLPADCPTCMKFDWRTDKEVVVKIRIQPTGAKVEIVGGVSSEVKKDFKAGGHIGFSFQSGDPSSGFKPDQKSTYIELKGLQVTNHDSSASGEDVHELRAAPERGEKADVLAGSSSFKDPRAESDAIKDLTNMVFKLVVESQPQRQQMARAIDSLMERVRAMEANFQDLKAELDKKTGHKLGEEFEGIKKELFSLSKFTSKETDDKRKRLDVLHTDIATVHKTAQSSETLDKHLDKLADSNQKVLTQLTSEHQSMFGVSLMGIVFILIGGLSLYNKFRCWEKKHIL
jgi:hypothetical protein